jgi:hypothetical protein
VGYRGDIDNVRLCVCGVHREAMGDGDIGIVNDDGHADGDEMEEAMRGSDLGIDDDGDASVDMEEAMGDGDIGIDDDGDAANTSGIDALLTTLDEEDEDEDPFAEWREHDLVLGDGQVMDEDGQVVAVC